MSNWRFAQNEQGDIIRLDMRNPRNGWQATTPEQFEEIRNPPGLASTIAEQIKIGAQRSAGGMGIMIADTFGLDRPEGYAEQNLQSATERGQFLSEMRPGTGAAQFVPDVALALAGGGASMIARGARGIHSANVARQIPVRAGVMSAKEADTLGIQLTSAQRALLMGKGTAEHIGRERAMAGYPIMGKSLTGKMARQSDQLADVAMAGTGLEGTRAVSFQRLNTRITAVERQVAERGGNVMVPTSNRQLLSNLDDLPVHEQQVFARLAGDKVSVADVARVRGMEAAGIVSSEKGTRLSASLMDDVLRAAPNDPKVAQLVQQMDALEVLKGIKYNSVRDADGMIDLTRSVAGWRDRGLLSDQGMAAKALNTMDYIHQPFGVSVSGKALEGVFNKYTVGGGIGLSGLSQLYGQMEKAVQNLQ